MSIHCTPELIIAWLLAKKPWIVPNPGTTNPQRLEENLAAVSIELTLEDVEEIDEAASKLAIEGDRYPVDLQAATGRQLVKFFTLDFFSRIV